MADDAGLDWTERDQIRLGGTREEGRREGGKVLVDVLTSWAAGPTEGDFAEMTRDRLGVEGGPPPSGFGHVVI